MNFKIVSNMFILNFPTLLHIEQRKQSKKEINIAQYENEMVAFEKAKVDINTFLPDNTI